MEPNRGPYSEPDQPDNSARQMTVMLFDHARLRLPKVLHDNQKRHAAHDGLRRPGVSQPVETCWRIDVGVLADLSHYSRLLRLPSTACQSDRGSMISARPHPE